jgi:hypothetical protein
MLILSAGEQSGSLQINITPPRATEEPALHTEHRNNVTSIDITALDIRPGHKDNNCAFHNFFAYIISKIKCKSRKEIFMSTEKKRQSSV